MNRFFSLIWNEAKQAYVPVPEILGGSGRSPGSVLAAVAALMALSLASKAHALDAGALPTGGHVTAGQAQISQSGSSTVISQGSANAAIDWQSFNIGSQAKVTFVQPSAAAIALNRVTGNEASQIYGSLQANGQVFLINPNGVLFAKGAQVSAAGVLVSTRDMSTEDFLAGKYKLAGSGTGKVINQGSITAKDGGYVALIGAQVINDGQITANRGDVRMAAANMVTVKIDNGGLTALSVEKGTLEALAANGGLIKADGGRVFLTADALDQLTKAVVNNDGIIEARSIQNRNGVIRLAGDADVGQATVRGTLDVSSADGKGGDVVVTARDVVLEKGARINATGAAGGGTVRVGGGWQGKDSTVANAATVDMKKGAAIDVSATGRGDGGTAVLWSQDRTRFSGTIKATGGAKGGKGGKVETSGHQTLQAVGAVDASAAKGENGVWLLDPANVTIAASSAAGTAYGTDPSAPGTNTYDPAGTDSIILASAIQASLNAGVDVTITTGATGTSDGDITVNAPITMDTSTASRATLTLLAAHDITVNATVSYNASSVSNPNGRLNVVLNADTDANNTGSIIFTGSGKVLTNGGNFYAGRMAADGRGLDIDPQSVQGQNFTMAAGSVIDVKGGMLGIRVNGDVTLAAGSLKNNSTGYGSVLYNDGTNDPSPSSYVQVAGATITSTNTVATTPDILTYQPTTLAAGTIGSSANPIKAGSGQNSNSATTLSVVNLAGSSYVNEIGTVATPTAQTFNTVDVTIGHQANSIQNIQLRGDAGGNGTTGTGHILMRTDGNGVLNLNPDTATYGDIKTAGTPYDPSNPYYSPTNVKITADTITFVNDAVDTGISASFTATAGVAMYSLQVDNQADVKSPNVTLNGPDIGTDDGTSTKPVELFDTTDGAIGGSLTVNNTGGSTFLKSVNDGFYNISLTNVKAAGTHSILFSGGDHIDFTTDGSSIMVPTIASTVSDSTLAAKGWSDGETFGTTHGIELSAGVVDDDTWTYYWRGLAMYSVDANIIFGTNAVNMGVGTFSASINKLNTSGVIAALDSYNSGSPAAQIRGGDISFSVMNEDTPTVSTIGAGGKDIQLQLGVNRDGYSAANFPNTLSIGTQQGSVHVHELSNHQFRNITLSLNKGNHAQNVMIDLVGPDDINFSDSGSLITLSAAKVNVSDYDRSFTLSAGGRDIQIDGNSLSSGSYTVSGRLLSLNGDITTKGYDFYDLTGNSPGAISLSGATGINLLKSVLIDSNAESGNGRLGTGGSIGLGITTGSISSSGGSYSLTLNSSALGGIAGDGTNVSDDPGTGGAINLTGSLNDRAGFFLSGLTVNAKGYAAGGGVDGAVSLNRESGSSGLNYLLNGSLSVTGNTSLASGKPVVIDTEQGNNGSAGDITFAGADLSHGVSNANSADDTLSFNASTTAAGGNGGTITLLTDTHSTLTASAIFVLATGGSGGTGGTITLPAVTTAYNTAASPAPANTQTYSGAVITLNGNLTSDKGAISLTATDGTRLATSVSITTGTTAAAAVTFSGGVSASAAGAGLTIGTTSNTGGSVTLGTADNAGGHYLNSLAINAANSTRTFTLGNIATEGAQTYTGGAATITGGTFSSNGGTITFGFSSLATLTTALSIDTDRAGGTNNAGAFSLGSSVALNGAVALAIDTTADGGGTAAALTLGNTNGIGNNTALSSIDIKAGSVTVGSLGLRSSGAITVEARGTAADITLNGAVTETGSSDIVLAAGRNFINNKSSNTGIVTGSGSSRYLVYSANPANSTEGMTGYSKHYNETYAAGSPPSYAGSGNWFLYSIAPVISATSGVSSITYGDADPTINNPLTAANYSGFIDGDTLAANFTGSQNITLTPASQNSGAGFRPAGTYAFILNGTLTDDLGYQYATYSESLTVDAKSLSVTGVTAGNKTYDGYTTATLVGTAAVSALSGDTVVLDTSGAAGVFASKDAGTGRSVTVSGYTISGADANNYTLAQPTGLTADITKKTLTISGSSADKVYDGSATGVITAGTATGLVGSETLSITGSGTFADKNIGSKSISVTYSLSNGTNGGLADNYSLAGETLTGTITAKTITVAATGVGKTYDGLTDATATYASGGVVSGDDVSFDGTAVYGDKNAGTGKTVSVTGLSKSGTDAGNYTLSSTTASTTADITAKAITVTATGVGKTYDGLLGASATYASGGVIAGDDVSFDGTAVYGDKNAGTGKAVTVSGLSKSGTDAGNYTLSSTTASTTADITAKAITVTATGVGKTYDGLLGASATYDSSGLVSGDDVSFTGTAVYGDKNADTGKAVSITGIGKSGTDAGNYTLNNTTASTTADITAKAITVTATGVGKTYDGLTDATATYASGGVVSGDDVDFTGTAAYATKDAGTGRTITVSGLSKSGTDAGNYTLSSTTASTTADITAKAITVTATGVGKTYDGLLGASATYDSSGVISGDDVSFDGTAVYGDKNVGTGKAVMVSGISKSGTDAGNYTLNNTTASTTADITAKAITVTATGVGKTYDRLLDATATYASGGVISGDDVDFTGTATYATKDAGTGKTITVTGLSKSGTDAGNYTLSSTTASTTADITAKAITVTATGVGKTYDGLLGASATYTGSGVISGDDVGFTGTAVYGDKNAGTGKTVTITGIGTSGTDGGNYTVSNATASTTADITAKAITVTATGVGKTYDGLLGASATYASSGMVTGDDLNFTGTAVYGDRNAGTGKAVTVTGIGKGGTDAGNYTLNNTTASTTADITAKAITVTATGVGKTYDGLLGASATYDSSGVIAGDDVSFDGTAVYGDKNAGTGKAITVSGLSKSGTDAGNYTLSSTTASTTADITAKAITVTATGVGKTYDGLLGASATYAGSGLVTGDSVSFTGTAVYGDRNAGTGKAVAVSGISKSGTDAGNYTLNNTTASTTADITAKTITVTATGVGKTYDGLLGASATYASSGVIAGDSVSFDGTAVYGDKNAGTGKTITVSGLSKSGTDAGNYTLSSTTASTTADITARAITVTATGVGKTYDGLLGASATYAGSGVIAGDDVGFTGTAVYGDKNVGTGKAVTVSGIGTSGTDGGNYVVSNATASTTADITAKAITVTATGVGKTYDGLLGASATYASGGMVTGDDLSFTGTAVYGDRNAGTGKAVTVTGIGKGGTDAGNYTLNNTTASTTADITAKAITVTATAVNKTYDGSTAVGVLLGTTGLVSGDVVSFSGVGTLRDKNAGTGKAVLVTGIAGSGASVGNYLFNDTAEATVDVAAKAIGVTLRGLATKPGDGSTQLPLTGANYLVTGLIGGESVNVTRTRGELDNPNPGTGKLVTVTLGAGDYAAGAGTVLSNYSLVLGTLSGAIGVVTDSVAVSPSYTAALASVPVNPTVMGPMATAAIGAGSVQSQTIISVAPREDNSGTVQAEDPKVEAGIVSIQNKENLIFRRTFSIADGGIRLPTGLSEIDAAQ